MPPNPGLVARVGDAVYALGERGVRQKNVFGGRGFLVGKSTFAIVWDESLIVKTAVFSAGARPRGAAAVRVPDHLSGGGEERQRRDCRMAVHV